MAQEEKKICLRCEKEKEVSEFRKHNTGGNYLSTCTKCWNEINFIKDLICCIKHKFQFSKRAKLGCGKCNGNVIDKDSCIEKIRELYPQYEIKDFIYIGNKTKVELVCPKHGNFIKNVNKLINAKQGCQSCNYSGPSKAEIKISEFLLIENIKFEQEKSFDKNYSFDFYLPDLDICIEYDGEYHYGKTNHKLNDKIFETQSKRDEIKTQYCKDNNIKLIRIPYWDFKNIEQILTKELYGNIIKN